MSKLRWGVLGAAKIALYKVIPATQASERNVVAAIASRSLDKARAAADQCGVATAYGSYEELLADPNIDAIYNPLPNHLHVPWSIKALEAGKHVLCEKPVGLSSAEARELVAAAEAHPRLKVMEAFMYRHHPQWQAAKLLVYEGRIGALRTIFSFFSYFNVNADDIRNQNDIGGGAMMDIGCYPVSLSRFIFDAEPSRVAATIERDPKFQVDRLSSAILQFDGGTSVFTCSTQVAPYQRVHLVGETGRVEIEIPFNAPPDRPCKIWLQTEAGIEEIELPTTDQYTVQADLFAAAVAEDQPVPTPLSDAVANMAAIEAIFAAGASGAWTTVG